MVETPRNSIEIKEMEQVALLLRVYKMGNFIHKAVYFR